MRGEDVTPDQMVAAKKFIESSILLMEPPAFDQSVTFRYEDLVRMVAWHGSERYRKGFEDARLGALICCHRWTYYSGIADRSKAIESIERMTPELHMAYLEKKL